MCLVVILLLEIQCWITIVVYVCAAICIVYFRCCRLNTKKTFMCVERHCFLRRFIRYLRNIMYNSAKAYIHLEKDNLYMS